MVITSISLFIYGIGTVTSLAMTYIEGARRDKSWDFYRVTGIVLCFLAGARAASRTCDGLFVFRFPETAREPDVVRQAKDTGLTVTVRSGVSSYSPVPYRA